MFRRLADWLDARTGFREVLADKLDRPLTGGPRWSRALGPALLALLALEALTGVGLAAFYAPTAEDAWASVNFVQNQVPLGWLLRGLHHVNSTALIVVMGLHLFATLLQGGYRAPRELTWMTGIVVLLVVVVTSHMGYLLPGDLRAYWATQVLLSITAGQPFVGEKVAELIQGGPEYGNFTLTRMYAAHIVALPAVLLLALWAHRVAWLRHAAAPLPGEKSPPSPDLAPRYDPSQLARDLAVSLLAVGSVWAYVVATRGVELHAPADPAAEFIARPEWYFLPIFELRHFFPGRWEFIATSVIPGAAVGFLLALPFLYERLARWFRYAHGALAAAVVLGVLGAGALGGYRVFADSRDPEQAKVMAKATVLAAEAQRLAAVGVPLAGPLELYRNDPLVFGRRVLAHHCESCHKPCAKEKYDGVLCLEGYASRAWLTAFMKDPAAPHFFGNTKIDEMDAWGGDDAGLKALVEFLYAEGDRPDTDAALAARGRELYQSEGCESCHALTGEGTGDAPDLKGFSSEPWLRAFIRTPGAERFYGDDLNEMEDFPHEKLAADELEAVIAYLRAQAARPVKFQ